MVNSFMEVEVLRFGSVVAIFRVNKQTAERVGSWREECSGFMNMQ